MKPIAILPDFDASKLGGFSAFSEKFQASGRTAGEALDALIAQSTEDSSATPVIVQRFHPDQFFSESQLKRLSELMSRWRTAQERNMSFHQEN